MSISVDQLFFISVLFFCPLFSHIFPSIEYMTFLYFCVCWSSQVLVTSDHDIHCWLLQTTTLSWNRFILFTAFFLATLNLCVVILYFEYEIYLSKILKSNDHWPLVSRSLYKEKIFGNNCFLGKKLNDKYYI